MPDPAMPDTPATHLQLIRVVSRLFAAYLLFWVIADIIQLPHEIMTVVRVVNDARAGGVTLSDPRIVDSYRIAMLYPIGTTLEIALWLLGAGWFYRCGPRIQRFFSPETFAPHTHLEPRTMTLEPPQKSCQALSRRSVPPTPTIHLPLAAKIFLAEVAF